MEQVGQGQENHLSSKLKEVKIKRKKSWGPLKQKPIIRWLLVIRFLDALNKYFSKGGSWSSCIKSTKPIESDVGTGAQNLVLTSPSGDSDACQHLRNIVLNHRGN